VTISALRAPAYKEWAAVVQALLEGEQILDVRKGGIREDGRHFSVRSSRLWLYPTLEHQRPELLKPAYARWIETGSAPGGPPPSVPDATGPEASDRGRSSEAPHFVIAGWADVVGAATTSDPDVLDALDGKVIWSREYVETRFQWKRRDPLWILALRVHRLHEPIAVPYRDEYGGCTSWVDVDGLPDDPASLLSSPVLSDVAFEAKLKGAAGEIPGGFHPPTVESSGA
jgi:hypothetical protein